MFPLEKVDGKLGHLIKASRSNNILNGNIEDIHKEFFLKSSIPEMASQWKVFQKIVGLECIPGRDAWALVMTETFFLLFDEGWTWGKELESLVIQLSSHNL